MLKAELQANICNSLNHLPLCTSFLYSTQHEEPKQP